MLAGGPDAVSSLDNGFSYIKNRSLRELLASYRSHRHRNRALPHWLDHYNQTRPHSSLGGQPPISRVHNVRG